MIAAYFKIAWRNLVRNRAFSVINIAGLAIGMACTMLILLWVHNERSWDKNHKNYNNIYHVLGSRDFNGEINTGQDMMYPLATAAKQNFPEVEKAAVVSFGGNVVFGVGDKSIYKNAVTVSPEFFDIFTFKTIQGDARSAIKDPDAVVLTKSTALALFDNTNVVGQTVRINNGRNAIVKAVVEDVPRNSTVNFEAVVAFNPSSPDIKEAETDWVNCGNRVFFQTKPNSNIAALESKTLDLIKKNSPSANPTTRGSIALHPMSKWRLYEQFEDGKNTGGRIEYVNLFTWIALIILLIACVNFMNLSTARSEKRAKEVGIRKTLGSERKQLLFQFVTESVLVSFFSFLIAVCIVYTSIPSFSNLLNEDINVPLNEPGTWLLVGGMFIITGIIAGSYPAFYLSGFNPVRVLKGSFLPGKQALLPRKILVTSQFAVSIILISATLIIFQQLQFVKNRELGYDQNNLIMINSNKEANTNYNAIKNDLLTSGKIENMTRTSAPLTTIFGNTSGIRWKDAPPGENLVIGFVFASEEFAKTVGTKILAGRDFKAGDSNRVIFNKAAIETMGMKDPVGKIINWAGRDREIVGIIDNMVMTSPYDPASPLMVTYEDRWSNRLNVRLAKNTDVKAALATIETTFKKYSPGYPFQYSFVDEEYQTKFNNEQLIGKLSVIFAGLAIFICCLGLFGLVASSIERRKKEIGIRKVLGASVRNLLLLMSKEFLILVLIAFLIAVPAAWWWMTKWLENYTYRIDIGFGVFAAVALLTTVIALITVSLNASKAALSNPVKTLRSE